MPLPAAAIAIGKAALPGLIKGIGGLFGGRKRRKARERAREAQKQAWNAVRNFEYTQDVENPYANFTNTAGDVTNVYEDLTNPYQDLRVNTQQAEFQAEQNAQSQANILDALVQGGGVAGASATALATQATNANAKISADIGRQEAANQQAAAQGEASRQQAFARGLSRVQETQMRELQRLQNAEAKGSEYVQKMNQARDDQRFNVDMFALKRADRDYAQANAAYQAGRNRVMSGFTSALSGGLTAGLGSGLIGGGFKDSGNASDPFSSNWDIDAAVANSQPTITGYATDDYGYTDISDLD